MAVVDIIFQIDDPFVEQVKPRLLEQALRLTLQEFNKAATSTVTVVITDTDTIQQLNHQYRGLDSPTDVLSFANRPDPDFPGLDQDHLGEIIIAYPIAESQARTGKHTPLEELTLLTVHGALHLLGFDHDTLPNKAEMWAAQQEIMASLGLAHVQPTED